MLHFVIKSFNEHQYQSCSNWVYKAMAKSLGNKQNKRHGNVHKMFASSTRRAESHADYTGRIMYSCKPFSMT